jgi:hypothetical protein
MKRAVDLDGTLASYDGKETPDYDPTVIGPPIQKMVKRVKRWLAQGDEVVIFTARMHPKHGMDGIKVAEEAIKTWCVWVFGRTLEVTCMKDPEIKEFWDDKAIRVQRDDGSLEVYSESESTGDPIGDFLR